MDATVARMDVQSRESVIYRTNFSRIMKQKKKREIKAKEHNLRIREISDSLKRNNIQIIVLPEDEERKRGRRFRANHSRKLS